MLNWFLTQIIFFLFSSLKSLRFSIWSRFQNIIRYGPVYQIQIANDQFVNHELRKIEKFEISKISDALVIGGQRRKWHLWNLLQRDTMYILLRSYYEGSVLSGKKFTDRKGRAHRRHWLWPLWKTRTNTYYLLIYQWATGKWTYLVVTRVECVLYHLIPYRTGMKFEKKFSKFSKIQKLGLISFLYIFTCKISFSAFDS